MAKILDPAAANNIKRSQSGPAYLATYACGRLQRCQHIMSISVTHSVHSVDAVPALLQSVIPLKAPRVA